MNGAKLSPFSMTFWLAIGKPKCDNLLWITKPYTSQAFILVLFAEPLVQYDKNYWISTSESDNIRLANQASAFQNASLRIWFGKTAPAPLASDACSARRILFGPFSVRYWIRMVGVEK